MQAVEEIRNWLNTSGFEGAVFARRDNFKWIMNGLDSGVVTNVEVGVAYLIVEAACVKIVADASDCNRINEECNPYQWECVKVPWFEDINKYVKNLCLEKNYVSDVVIKGTVLKQDEFVNIRLTINEEQHRKYKAVAQECATIVELVANEAEIGNSELEIANQIKIKCIEKGISPDCVLVGVDERIKKYRHPMPTEKKLKKILMIVLGGEKFGFNVSLTRMVCFGNLEPEMASKMKSTQKVFASMQTLMAENLSIQEYFEKVKAVYKDLGWENEWMEHHQGGPTGYSCREFVITQNTTGEIRSNQAYAWNPTIQGTKCEETTFLNQNGIEILTRTQNWPCVDVETANGTVNVTEILMK